jgi:hypothetical protein
VFASCIAEAAGPCHDGPNAQAARRTDSRLSSLLMNDRWFNLLLSHTLASTAAGYGRPCDAGQPHTRWLAQQLFSQHFPEWAQPAGSGASK